MRRGCIKRYAKSVRSAVVRGTLSFKQIRKMRKKKKYKKWGVPRTIADQPPFRIAPDANRGDELVGENASIPVTASLANPPPAGPQAAGATQCAIARMSAI